MGWKSWLYIIPQKGIRVGSCTKMENYAYPEDDFMCLSQEDFLWESLDEIFYNNNEWNVMYLGLANPSGPVRLISKINQDRSLFQIQGAKTTHAYLVKLDLQNGC